MNPWKTAENDPQFWKAFALKRHAITGWTQEKPEVADLDVGFLSAEGIQQAFSKKTRSDHFLKLSKKHAFSHDQNDHSSIGSRSKIVWGNIF
jgi:hypothetical protein